MRELETDDISKEQQRLHRALNAELFRIPQEILIDMSIEDKGALLSKIVRMRFPEIYPHERDRKPRCVEDDVEKWNRILDYVDRAEQTDRKS